jgi:MFS family permease
MSLVKGTDLTSKERSMLFWASFLSLTAAGFGFAFRVAMGGDYAAELKLTDHQVGQVFGASLWPIAITMIGFSLVVDRIGYKLPMYGAFVLQILSAIGTWFADGYGALYGFALCAGLGHGIVEAVINPICAAVYPKEKTKWLTILHAAWPAGLVFGTLCIIGSDAVIDGGMGWRFHALWMVIPVVAYAVMYLPCRFPVDERVQAGVPYIDMLRQVGFLGAVLPAFMITYEVGNQIDQLTEWTKPESWFNICLGVGVGVGGAFGFFVKGIGKPLFFLMCLLMIPVATAELGTDGWIKKLMTPVLEGMNWNAALAIVFSAAIMLVLRIFAGGILKIFSPPALLCVSGIFSAIGLFWLSEAAGWAVFVAFIIYALGQTYYWPCVLGFVSERYPQGGALTLNTVSAIGLLSAGILGTQLLGISFDTSVHAAMKRDAPALERAAAEEKRFLGFTHQAIIPKKKEAFLETVSSNEKERIVTAFTAADKAAGRDVLAYAARFPVVLFVAFGLIVVYFRSKGGYKPILLNDGEE